MSEYQRKKVHKRPFTNKKVKNLRDDNLIFEDEIEPREEKPVKKKAKKVKSEDAENFKVIKSGKKLKPGKMIKVILALVAVCLVILCVNFCLPTGIVEWSSNLFATFGSGEYPVTYDGSLLVDLVQNGSYYYVLNDTSVSAFNMNGKEIFTDIHGFSNPVLSVSAERALVFDQNGNEAKIYNLSGLVKDVTTKNGIINASICRNGSYVISTDGIEYTSTVTVYNKNNKKLYTWNSAKDIINNAVLSANGKKLAISCLNVSGGHAVSKLYVLEYNSADPVFQYDFSDKFVLGIRNTDDGFGCVTEDDFTWFSWNNYKKTVKSVQDKTVSVCRGYKDNTLIVFNRESDRSDNRVMLLDPSGEIITEFDYKSIITDVEFKGDRIIFISDTQINVYSDEAKKLNSVMCDYGCKRFAICSSERIAVVTDDSINEISVE